MLNQAHPPWSQGILAIKLSQKQLPEALLLFSLKEDAEMVSCLTKGQLHSEV